MTTQNKHTSSKLAAILVRGFVSMERSAKDTLLMLKLTHKNRCVVVNNTPAIVGMIKKVKDYITWGEISEDTFKELVVSEKDFEHKTV